VAETEAPARGAGGPGGALTLLVSALGPDRRAALLEGDRLRRLAFSPPGDGLAAGDVCLGRVLAVDRRLAACFVDVGEARPGFLMLADAAPSAPPPTVGEAIVCRVLRGADAGKGAKLACRPPPADQPGAGLRAAAPGLRPPLRLRTAPRGADRLIAGIGPGGPARLVVDDARLFAQLKRSRPDLAGRLALHGDATPLFAAYDVDAAEAALAPQVALASGGVLAIRETPAAVTVDVDLAAAADAAAANLEAMAEIARQIGLRDLAGHIVIDPLPTRSGRLRRRMLATLAAALAADALPADGRPAEDDQMEDAQMGDDQAGGDPPDGPGAAADRAADDGAAPRVVRIGGFTALGLIELTRERLGPSLARLAGEPCAGCGGGWQAAAWLQAGDALRWLLAEARRCPGRLPLLVVSPPLAAALAGPMAAVRRVAEERLGQPIAVRVDPQPDAAGYRLEPDSPG
jgi:hypothetical protein